MNKGERAHVVGHQNQQRLSTQLADAVLSAAIIIKTQSGG